MTRRSGPQVRIHPTKPRLIVEDAGVRMELEFTVAGRLADEMAQLLRTFDPSRSTR